jgi:site-specific recombinase XerD
MVVHLGKVLALRGSVEIPRLNEQIVEDFIRHHLPSCCCYRRKPHKQYAYSCWALGHLLTMLREEGAILPICVGIPPYHDLLGDYCRFLANQRGLAPRTVVTYRGFIRDFLAGQRTAVTPTPLVQLTPDDLLAFGRKRGSSLGASSWNHLVLSLASFYRWLEL